MRLYLDAASRGTGLIKGLKLTILNNPDFWFCINASASFTVLKAVVPVISRMILF
jgi:hypothetical protein